MKKEMTVFGLACVLVMLICGCASQTCVVATSQTGVGFVVSYNAQSQMPEGKFGYLRNEVAIVPTNRTPDCAYDKDSKVTDQGGSGGAKEAPNVIMDFNVANWFAFWDNQNLSNRIAVGDKAVKVAPFLFMSNMTPAQIEALAKMEPMIHDMTVLAAQEDAADNNADAAVAGAKKAKIAAKLAQQAKVDTSAAVDTGMKTDAGK